MNILVVNCGSSSLKYQLINMENETLIAKGTVERIGIDGSNLVQKVSGRENYVVKKEIKDHVEAANIMFSALTDEKNGVIKSLDEITAIGHRVLHGGIKLTESTVVDDNVKNPGRKRNAILNKDFKYVGINSQFIGKKFVAYFAFSK